MKVSDVVVVMRVDLTVTNARKSLSYNFILSYPLAFGETANRFQRLHLPFPTEAWQAGLAGEELLHHGLLDVALLGGDVGQRGQQGIHIPECYLDSALFRRSRQWNLGLPDLAQADLWICLAGNY